jgi:hypothetical protein
MPLLRILCYNGSLVNLSQSQSESELFYDWRFTANQFFLTASPLRLTSSTFIFQLNTCCYSPYVTVILRPDSSGTHDHISHSQIRDSTRVESQLIPLNFFPLKAPRHKPTENVVPVLLRACTLRALPSKGRSLHSHFLATWVYSHILQIPDMCLLWMCGWFNLMAYQFSS